MTLRYSCLLSFCAFQLCAAAAPEGEPDVKEIIAKSVEANQRDFKAAPDFNWKERDRTPSGGSKTYQVEMIDGSPYYRLIMLNGKPLSPAQEAQEKRKEQQARQQRKSESPAQRKQRIAKFERERQRDNTMMNQLTNAFDFKFVGERNLDKFNVYVLKATPRQGYTPPNLHARVLTGMEGELWIDRKTYQWVKVTAEVIHPVSIEGFLAKVEPGTQFELEKAPVGDGSVWLAAHFAMRANARVLGMFNHNSQEDDTFWDYTPVK